MLGSEIEKMGTLDQDSKATSMPTDSTKKRKRVSSKSVAETLKKWKEYNILTKGKKYKRGRSK